MNERECLLRQLSSAQFAAWELHIYLDTHSDDARALEMYEKYTERFEKLRCEFEKKFGPLSVGNGTANEWLADPWPWEREGADC